jgi:hypothetical protein
LEGALDPKAKWHGVERPLDNGIAYVVVTMRDRLVIELKGCADRTAAMTYAQTGTVQG